MVNPSALRKTVP
jgi:hypothetical protein